MTLTFTAGRAAGRLPVLGHVLPLLKDPQGFISSLPSYGDLVRLRIGPFSVIVVCHPELTRQVLLNDRIFDKGGPLFQAIREVVGNGVATCPSSDHRRQRRFMQPAFHQSRLPSYAAVMSQQITAVTSTWRDGQVIDAFASMQAITAKVAALTMFAAPASTTVLNEVRDAIHTIMRRVYIRMLAPSPLDKLPTPGKRRFDHARARLRQITHQFITEYQHSGIDHHDLISLLLSYRDDDNRPLSEEEICDQVTTLLIGGTETTSALLAWAVYLVALHPHIQQQLYDEARAVVAGHTATWDDLPNLNYTGRVITETLRHRPPAWLFTRRTTTNTELGGHLIPAGSTVVYSPYLLHHRADLYAEPECFNPDRWAGESSTLPLGAYVPFALGARKCIGDIFAITEAILVLASIVRSWELLPTTTKPVRPIRRATLVPKVTLRLAQRN